jgi:asparagine synthase (glutamine-hydrolysing)
MNAIFGLLNLDGAPASIEELEAMQAALAFWALDGAQVWRNRQAGLGCLQAGSTPQAAGERLPLYDAASGLALTAGARLDNRADLIDLLELDEGSPAEAISDAELILHAYLRWGEDCVAHLDGDWHFALWDERQRRLFLARDHHGNTGLYYYHDAHHFYFASSKKALLAIDAIPKQPNMLRIAQLLTAWPGDGVQTGYVHIFRLPPAHLLSVSPGGMNIRRYWFPENVSELRLKSDDDYLEAFMEAFTRAVSARLRCQRPVGVTLSGGLDSGSVTAVAAAILRQRGERLIAFTSTPLRDPSQYTDARRFGDETWLAGDTARQAGNVEHVLIPAGEISPLAAIERMLWVHDEPMHAAGNQYWLAALLEAARQRGVGSLLTGQLGNAVISWTGAGENLLPRLWRSLLPGPQAGEAGFWQAFEAACRGAGLGRWRAARRFLLKPLFIPIWYEMRRRGQFGANAWQRYSAIHPEFARQIGLQQRMAAAGYLPQLQYPDPLQRRLAIIQPGRMTLGTSWNEKGGAYGLEVRDPTQDRRLIELCLAIPESQYQRQGVDRWLVRRAMQGYLPDAVRLNTRRGLQAADLGERVLASRNEVESALARLSQHDLARQVLDLERMRNVLASLEQGMTSRKNEACGTILLRGLMVGLFLLRFSDY